MSTATPWDVLLRRRPAARTEPQQQAPAGETKTALLLQTIDTWRHVTTMNLCLETDLDSRVVWGLLKSHRKSGRVQFNYGEWSPGVSAASIKAQQAADMLRALGWTVLPPGGKGA